MGYWLGQKGINNLRKNIQTMNCSHQSPMFVYVCKNIKFVIQGKEKMLDQPKAESLMIKDPVGDFLINFLLFSV